MAIHAPNSLIRDRHTGSIGRTLSYLGHLPDSRDPMHTELPLFHKYSVRVVTPQAHHQPGDYVIWRNPTSAFGATGDST